MRKDQLREQMRREKRRFSQHELEELSLPVIARLRERLAGARTVFAYYSLPDEVGTHLLIDELAAAGKTVLLPKVTDADTMELRRYTGRWDLSEGAFRIMEPVGERLAGDVDIDVALIPGIAFDAAGHRLGRGRGYYDRFLSSHQSAIKHTIGVCFDFQKVADVPVDANDVPVDEVI